MSVYPALSFRAVSSSTGEIYEIAVARRGDNLTCTCTCPAGQNRTHCKHRLAVLAGDGSALQDAKHEDLALVAEMVAGTDVQIALSEMIRLQEDKAEIDKKLKAAKKRLARVLDD